VRVTQYRQTEKDHAYSTCGNKKAIIYFIYTLIGDFTCTSVGEVHVEIRLIRGAPSDTTSGVVYFTSCRLLPIVNFFKLAAAETKTWSHSRKPSLKRI